MGKARRVVGRRPARSRVDERRILEIVCCLMSWEWMKMKDSPGKKIQKSEGKWKYEHDIKKVESVRKNTNVRSAQPLKNRSIEQETETSLRRESPKKK